jgi:hypothetical protein
MNLPNSGTSAATAQTAAPAAAPTPAVNSPTLNPSSVTSGGNHRPLPPAADTNLQGDISLNFEDDGFPSTPESSTQQTPPQQTPASEQKTTTEPAEEADPFDVAPKSVKEALKKIAPEKPAEKAPEPQQEPEVSKETSGRQYTGITEVDNVLKKLGNKTYDAYKDQLPKWYEAYKAQQESPKYLAAHPEAYQLHPVYKEATQALNETQFEYNSLQEALIAAESGKPVQLLEGYEEATGKPVFKTYKPDANGKHDPRLKVHLNQAFQMSQTQFMDARRKVAEAKDTFKAFVAAEHKFVDESFGKIFKGVDPAQFTPEEAKYGELMKTLIPDSVTPEHARKLAHYAMVAQLRLAKQFQKYVEQTQAPAPRPQKGPSTAGESNDLISLDPDKMFA